MTDQPIGLPKPPQQADEDQRQQLHRMEVLTAQIAHVERLVLRVREFRLQQQLIYLLNGAIIGIVAFKAWTGL